MNPTEFGQDRARDTILALLATQLLRQEHHPDAVLDQWKTGIECLSEHLHQAEMDAAMGFFDQFSAVVLQNLANRQQRDNHKS